MSLPFTVDQSGCVLRAPMHIYSLAHCVCVCAPAMFSVKTCTMPVRSVEQSHIRMAWRLRTVRDILSGFLYEFRSEFIHTCISRVPYTRNDSPQWKIVHFPASFFPLLLLLVRCSLRSFIQWLQPHTISNVASTFRIHSSLFRSLCLSAHERAQLIFMWACEMKLTC